MRVAAWMGGRARGDRLVLGPALGVSPWPVTMVTASACWERSASVPDRAGGEARVPGDLLTSPEPGGGVPLLGERRGPGPSDSVHGKKT